jgi:ketosteroid isomerase-like protein
MSNSDENKSLVFQSFQPWEQGNSSPFFDLIADDVTWTVIGTTVASGVFHSKQEVIDRAYGPLLGRLNGPLTARFVDIAAEGEKVYLRFESSGIAKTGIHYNQAYCFAMVMGGGRIIEIVAYIDTDLLARLFE